MKNLATLILMLTAGQLISQTKSETETHSVTFPQYKKCHILSNEEDIKTCTLKKITNFIKLSFNYDVADRALPLEKTTKFQLDFTVDKKEKLQI